MSELDRVISSTALTEKSDAAAGKECPRELLGLSCIVNQYACLCEAVGASAVARVKDESGGAAVVRLTMTLTGKPETVMAGIDLTGYRADYEVSRQAVTASFNLRRPQNTPLCSFVAETDA